MRDQRTMCKMMILERKCADRAVRLHSALESQLSAGMPGSDVWDRTVSFFHGEEGLDFPQLQQIFQRGHAAFPLTHPGCGAAVL
uniref:Uncharacterized protein n=1 Tax=Mola mola TaxID=94237 RepID=A0A3Q3XF15_MOLML